jgi:hypothetical protein
MTNWFDDYLQSADGELFGVEFGAFEPGHEQDGATVVVGFPHLVRGFRPAKTRQLHDGAHDVHEVAFRPVQQDQLEARHDTSTRRVGLNTVNFRSGVISGWSLRAIRMRLAHGTALSRKCINWTLPAGSRGRHRPC